MLADALNRVKKNLKSYHEALEDPTSAQASLNEKLLKDYRKSEYGEQNYPFPVMSYQELVPWFDRIRTEDYRVLLCEEPKTWVMTRGTTGVSKIIPVTQKHLDAIVTGGSRAVLEFCLNHGGLSTLMGGVLNLQFPSNTALMMRGDQEITYGFSSGTYAKLNPMMAGLHLVPRQEEIDALETGLSRDDWEKRYEFIYQIAKDHEIVTIMGVAPVQTGFARYVKRIHGVYPRDIWSLKVIYTTSVSKIQSKYKPMLQKMYGQVPVVEMYTATEGAFGQQMDDFPYWRPNYDLYYFEVKTNNGVKMLHDMKRGEWGRLVISTPMLPRYLIGDLVEAMGKNYFRVFGRDKNQVIVEHVLYKLFFGWLS